MNWEAIGAVGEILGAAVVFITLIYLASQVRQAKLVAADANRLARTRGVNDMQLAQLANRDAFLAMAKANGTEGYYRKLAAEFDLTYEQALDVDAQSIYWFWLHWGQYHNGSAADAPVASPPDSAGSGGNVGSPAVANADARYANSSPGTSLRGTNQTNTSSSSITAADEYRGTPGTPSR